MGIKIAFVIGPKKLQREGVVKLWPLPQMATPKRHMMANPGHTLLSIPPTYSVAQA
jgi:hypothetical protein